MCAAQRSWGALILDLPLASVETAVLTQGVTFLYQQAGELLRRRREAKDRSTDTATTQQKTQQVPKEDKSGNVRPMLEAQGLPALEPPNEAFAADSIGRKLPIPAVLDELSSSLLEAYRNLDTYLLGDEPFEPNSMATLQAVDRLRRLLEQIYGTRLTFAGEQRHYTNEHSVTISHIQEGGVTAGGSIKVKGDIAGRDLNRR
jgi:hypothetical protein